MNKVRVNVGDIYKISSGREVVVTELLPKGFCRYNILGTDYYQKSHQYKMKTGKIKDKYYPTIAGKGFVGEGKYKTKIGSKHTKDYNMWRNMLERVYVKCDTSKPSYKSVSICEEWHNFQIFAEWCRSQKEFYYDEIWCLDKDINTFYNKLKLGIYSPATCFIVPSIINGFFVLRNSDRGDYPLGIHPIGKKFRAMVSFRGITTRSPLFSDIKAAVDWYYKTKSNILIELANEYKGLLRDDCYNKLITLEFIDPLLF